MLTAYLLFSLSVSLSFSPPSLSLVDSGSTNRPITRSRFYTRPERVNSLACALIYQGSHSFHVNDTRAPAKASSELRPPHRSRRRCRKIVIVVHVASTPLGASDEGRRRHRTSGVAAAAVEEEEEGVQPHRRRSCQPEMSDHGCIHLNNFKAAKGIQPYKVIHSYFVTSTSTEGRVRKVRLLLPRVRFVFPSIHGYAFFGTPSASGRPSLHVTFHFRYYRSSFLSPSRFTSFYRFISFPP